MIYSGKALRVDVLPSGIAQLVFDAQESSVNKFDRLTLHELREAVDKLQAADTNGVIFSSGKSSFIVGADITEFTALFSQPEEQIESWLVEANELFNAIEDLPVPTISAIAGTAMGGGFELAVATDYRVATANAVLGFPEVKLGLLPGFGGTVRLPRLIGADNANQWISSGSHTSAAQALAEGAIDAIVDSENLIAAAEKMIQQCSEGKLDYRKVREQKQSALILEDVELQVAFETARALASAQAGPHYPAPTTAIEIMQNAARMDRKGALELEHRGFVKLARTQVSANLIQIFLNEKYLKNLAKQAMAKAATVESAAVLGAGIMGGGIAYQSALSGIPIIMKDIAQDGLDLGMDEARKQLDKRVSRGKLSADKVLPVITRIKPALDYGSFDRVGIVVEAVVENSKVKKQVLAEVEALLPEQAILTSNTSTISIDELAQALHRPENFCGMHFFNPVPVMPLVEVIKGKMTSAETVATTVAYAKKLGKTPIVVKDCPGFLVNRILFPYFGAFDRLIYDGADFRQIDRVMEAFGWPMGPAYLLDVVGIDTAVHAQAVMAAGYQRMQHDFDSVIEQLYKHQAYGQKSGSGFYRYESDKRGKPVKLANPDVASIIASVQDSTKEFSDEEIVERMMSALCLETIRCLDDDIVGSPVEADMALVLGLGFPAFRGGALRYVDSMGAGAFCKIAEKYQNLLGPLYEPPESLEARTARKETFYLNRGNQS